MEKNNKERSIKVENKYKKKIKNDKILEKTRRLQEKIEEMCS